MADFFGSSTRRPADRYASGLGILIGGVAFVALGAFLASSLVGLWPAVDRVRFANRPKEVEIAFGLLDLRVTKSTGLLILAMLTGATGGYVHATTSFASYLGNRQFKASWGWWYVLRCFIGAGLGLFFYFMLRAGFVNPETVGQVNVYGVAAIGALGGLFSKQATNKLEEIFDTMFKTREGTGDDARQDSLSRSLPVISELDPNQVNQGEGRTIAVKGKGFDEKAKVTLEGRALETKFVGPGELSFQMTPILSAKPGTYAVEVTNPDGGKSAAKTLTVLEPRPA